MLNSILQFGSSNDRRDFVAGNADGFGLEVAVSGLNLKPHRPGVGLPVFDDIKFGDARSSEQQVYESKHGSDHSGYAANDLNNFHVSSGGVVWDRDGDPSSNHPTWGNFRKEIAVPQISYAEYHKENGMPGKAFKDPCSLYRYIPGLESFRFVITHDFVAGGVHALMLVFKDASRLIWDVDGNGKVYFPDEIAWDEVI